MAVLTSFRLSRIENDLLTFAEEEPWNRRANWDQDRFRICCIRLIPREVLARCGYGALNYSSGIVVVGSSE